MVGNGGQRSGDLLATQQLYYELRAPDYGHVSRPSDRKSRGLLDSATVRDVVDRLKPWGDVLEIAAGSGAFTRELVHHARSLVCVDGSPRMLALNHDAVGDPDVEYVCDDIFDWTPPRRYDEVFFGFWLSHVPPTHFDRFWSLVGSCLAPGGRVVFVDEDERGSRHEASRSEGDVPTARRRLSDGRTFDIVKVFWNPAELERRLAAAGWNATVPRLGATCYLGIASRP
jgi:demethylmenaquinone methyltransferase/2-methoxy-6-polyprenyl-1,4-benzoquinol methylase